MLDISLHVQEQREMGGAIDKARAAEAQALEKKREAAGKLMQEVQFCPWPKSYNKLSAFE